MANPLKKSLIYLGLADEELEYDGNAPHETAEQRPAPAPVQQTAPQAVAQPAPAAKKAASPVQPVAQTKAPVTPLRPTNSTKNAAPTEMNEILTVHPREYKDAQSIASSFRDGIPVIINLSQMSEGDARRLVDFASGLSQGLYGKIERVTNKVFLLSPSHIVVSGEQAEAAGDIDASFFAQS